MQTNIYLSARNHIRSITKYIVAGGSAAALDFGVFVLLLNTYSSWSQCLRLDSAIADDGLAISNAVAMIAGFIWSFVLQRNWAFKSNGNAGVQFVLTAVLLAVNIGITNILIPVFAYHIGISVEWSKFLVQVFVVVWNYIIYKYLIFRVIRHDNE